MKQLRRAITAALVAAAAAGAALALSPPAAAQFCIPLVNCSPPPAPPPPECSDGADNDADGKSDMQDPGCASASDNSEISQCGDGLDNDGDGRKDFGSDPGCSSKADHDETDPPLPVPQCSDGVDNDADGKADFGNDPGCSTAQDDDETSQCGDGLDNDGDGRKDFGAGAGNDPGCSSKADHDETDPPLPDPQCFDRVDNDGDGRVDSADPGCASGQDDDETSQCADRLDNDRDGKIDFGAGNDPGCSSLADHDESDPPLPTPQCSDFVDNDADGRTDGEDPGCTSGQDHDEMSQCGDALDNDGDGRVDFGDGRDPGCSSRADDDETDPPLPDPQCSDGVDNDGDGTADAADPGCVSAQDDDETSQCGDTLDNDGDGQVDTADPGCSALFDDDETGPAAPQAGELPPPASGLPGGASPTADPSPDNEDASSELLAAARRIAPPWADLQTESGLFRNPLTGIESPAGYGPVMIGHALMREGRRAGDDKMLHAGIRAVTAVVGRSTGVEENPLHLLAIASAYNWASERLGGDPLFQEARGAWERYLANWKSAGVGPGAQRCFADPRCFHSYDAIDAVAVLELFATGLAPGSSEAKLADSSARAAAISVLAQGAYHAMGRDARALGRGARLYRLGILSDSPANPLAYHALSIAALARGISLLGDAAPPEAKLALKRAIDATASFAGPDGDVAYIGRAHGAVWALGATVYAAHVCARLYPGFAPSTALRCDTLAKRALGRVVRDHDFGAAGVNAIPRFRTSRLDGRGLDPYANLISSNGLTAVFLEWAAEEERRRGGSPPSEPVPLPLDRGGAFIDPVATRFAVLRKGATWLAVHMEPTSLLDPRYDFGLMALKARLGHRRWRDVLPPRPTPIGDHGTASAGPVLIDGRHVGYPWGTRMSVDRAAGTITIHGGWRTRRGRWLRDGVAFRFDVVRRGVKLSFPAEEGDRFRIADYVPAGPARISGAAIETTGFVSTLTPAASEIERRPGYSSAYDASLVRVTRLLDLSDDGPVTWTIAAVG